MKLAVVLVALTLCACTQTMTLTSERGDPLSCTLKNDLGTWRATTPAKVRVLRSSQPLDVTCTKPGATWHEAIAGPDYGGTITKPMEATR